MRSPFITACLLLILLLIAPLTAAQEEPPAPQFLYRDGDHLILLNGYTGETDELPFEVGEADRFTWSPDGRYLMTQARDGELKQCLKLYEVDKQVWLDDEPIACGVREAVFSPDGTQIVYSTRVELNEALWLYNMTDATKQLLYRTTGGTEVYEAGISILDWSPSGKYLEAVTYNWITGGADNYLIIMNIEDRHHYLIVAPEPYYASYDPIWSDDDQWFLLTLKEGYLRSNHQGDIYLVEAETGSEYRLTYTPNVYESDPHWTDEGAIAYTAVVTQDIRLTLEEAMNVEAVPEESIVMPGPIDRDDYRFDHLQDVMVSPDPQLGAWINSRWQGGGLFKQLDIGAIQGGMQTERKFSIPLPNYYESSNRLIGWRPSDYPYPQG